MSDTGKKTLFDYFTQYLVPLVVAILSIFSKQPRVAIGLICLGALSIIISVGPSLIEKVKTVKTQIGNREQTAFAKSALDDLKVYVNKFGGFVSLSLNDGLFSIVHGRLCQSHQQKIESLNLPPFVLFSDMWSRLKRRIDKQQPSLDALRDAVSDFNAFVGAYSLHMVCPVFDKVPSKLSDEMLTTYKNCKLHNDLTQFRERFDRFLEGYTDFVNSINHKVPETFEIPYFQHPKVLENV